jgi:hypothetical protein
MTVMRRVALVLAGPIVLAGLLAVAALMPGVRQCVSISCGSHFDPGGANVFGHEVLTPEQSIVVAFGIWGAAVLFGRGVLPARSWWLPIGFGLFALATVVAFTLPSWTIGPPPSIPCVSPGVNGLAQGRCITGPPPVDDRLWDRAIVEGAGVVALGAASLIDRKRPSSRDALPISSTVPSNGS